MLIDIENTEAFIYNNKIIKNKNELSKKLTQRQTL
jgi:hypothetical protein